MSETGFEIALRLDEANAGTKRHFTKDSSYNRCMNLSIHHITLTVANVKRSAQWYQALLGEAELVERQMDGWKRVRMAWPSGLVIGVTQYDRNTDFARFTHLNAGLDHFGFRCHSEIEVKEWAKRISELGFSHGPIEEVPYGWAVTARDPDNIPVEFFCPKP
jgi:catechol 2,3-dioxygenase-like lactoylglutathione lyase family enzyme